jgi:hypothetical protein
VRFLIERGHDVVIFHRGREECHWFPNLLHVHESRDVLPTLRRKLESIGPDVVLDVIPYTEKHALQAVEACRGIAGRIVAVSSSDVYRNYDGFRGKRRPRPILCRFQKMRHFERHATLIAAPVFRSSGPTSTKRSKSSESS